MVRRRRIATRRQKNTRYDGTTLPTKAKVTGWGYFKTVSALIPKMNSEIYQTCLQKDVLEKHGNWLDEEWVKFQAKLEKEKVAKTRKTKYKRKIVARKRRSRRRGGNMTKNTIQPSMAFANKVLNRFSQLQIKTLEKIDELALRQEKKTKRPPKLSRNERIALLRKEYAKNITYYTDFVRNYHEIYGTTKQLVSSLLKANALDFIVLFYLTSSDEEKTVFVKKYIDHNLIDVDNYDYLVQNGLQLSEDIRLFLSLSDKDTIKNELTIRFDEKEILAHLNLIDHKSVLKYLVHQNIIPHDKKTIKTYFKKTNLKLLTPIIAAGKYKPTQTDINSVFKPPKQTKKRRYYWSRRNKFNQSLSKKFTDVDRFIRTLIKQNIKVPYSKPFHDYLLEHGDLDIITYILDTQHKEGYPYDKRFEKLRSSVSLKRIGYHRTAWDGMIRTIIEEDDVDNFKKAIDYNLIMIEELHHNNLYLIRAIKEDATQIAKYMMEELRVKLLNYNPTSIWGWSFYRVPQNQMINNLRFMREHGIPIDYSILSTALNNGKHYVVSFLVDEAGFKLNKSHTQHIKKMSVKNFNKYADLIGLNKVKMLNSLAKAKKEHRYYWRRKRGDQKKQNAIVLNIITSQPRAEKKKLARKIAMIAMSNNNPALFSTLKSRYKFGYTLKELQTIVSRKAYTCGNHKLYLSIQKTQPELVEEIKKSPNDFKVKLLTAGMTESNLTTENIQHLIDIGTEIDIELVKTLYAVGLNENNGWGWYHDNTKLSSKQLLAMAKLMRSLPEYKTRDPDKLTKITNFLLNKRGMNLVNTLCSKTYNLYSSLSLKEIYSACLSNITQQYNLTDSMSMLLNTAKNKEITPLVWSIIRLGIQYTEANDNWRKVKPTATQITKLLSVQPQISQEDLGYFKAFTKSQKFQVIEYEKLDEEIPDNYDFYERNIAIMEERGDMDSEDMEAALANAEIEIINDLGEMNNDDILGSIDDSLGDSIDDTHSISSLDTSDEDIMEILRAMPVDELG
jgi:hypothetical protein